MGYQARYSHAARGFTLIEMMVVIAVIGMLASVSTTAYSSFKTHENLEIAANGVVEAIRYAQANAQSGKGGSSWGAEILPSSVVVFKGASYAGRDAASDQALDFPGGVTASGLSEIVFAAVTGFTANTGIVVMTNSSGTKNISINEKGTLAY